MRINTNYPVIVGLSGQACTGKTSVAKILAPMSSTSYSIEGNEMEQNLESMDWSHLFFALPIYRLAAARQKIQGHRSEDRIRYEIHDTLYDLFGRSVLFGKLPPYEQLVELVEHISSMYCEPPDEKARSFMQKVGSLCREYYENCFVDWTIRQAKAEFEAQEKHERPYCIVISDVRFPNEVDIINSQPNGAVIRFAARPEVLQGRAFNRDGKIMTEEEANHESETALLNVPGSKFIATLDASDMTAKQQAAATKRIIEEHFIGKKAITSCLESVRMLESNHAHQL